MAISQPSQHSYKRFIDAAKSLDQSQLKPAPQQPTWNTFALPKSSQQVADERERQRRYALAALESEAEKVRLAPDGTKHDRVRDSAMAVAGFVRSGAISEREIEETLYAAVVDRAEDKRNALETIRWGIEHGEAKPREIPPPRWASSLQVETDVLANEDLITELRNAPLTDAGNAECLALVYGGVFRYDTTRKKWLEWDGDRWLLDAQGAVVRATTRLARTRAASFLGIEDSEKRMKSLKFAIQSENVNRANAMLAKAMYVEAFESSIAQYDRSNWLAGVPGGTLDLTHQQIRASTPGDYITKHLGTHYDPEACAPRWQQFLREVFADDQELIAYIQRAVGYCLTGDTREEKFFLCYGGGANGKSKFLETIHELLGDYAKSASSHTFDADRKSEQTNDIAALKGARLVTVIETDDDRRLAEARVKQLTGRDPVTCRFLFQEEFTYTPTYKVWMAMNHKPIIRGSDRGIWRRVQLIPFTESFEGKEDKVLLDKLRAELPGILNWALEGLRQWQQHGLGHSQAIESATTAYRLESDLVAQWLAEHTEDDPEGRTMAAEAIESYRSWCKTYGHREPSATALKRSLEEKGYTQKRHGRGNVWIGLRLAEPTDATTPFTVGDVGHDQRATTQARLWLRKGEYAKAAEVARTVRGNREQQALLRQIDEAEREARK